MPDPLQVDALFCFLIWQREPGVATPVGISHGELPPLLVSDIAHVQLRFNEIQLPVTKWSLSMESGSCRVSSFIWWHPRERGTICLAWFEWSHLDPWGTSKFQSLCLWGSSSFHPPSQGSSTKRQAAQCRTLCNAWPKKEPRSRGNSRQKKRCEREEHSKVS